MSLYLFQVLNGVGIGMLYFLIAVGLTITFGLLHFVNFAHGVFYMLGAFVAFQTIQSTGNFWLALLVAPILVGIVALLIERFLLQYVHGLPIIYHILVTFGLALVVQESVIMVWGPVAQYVSPPSALQGVVIFGGFAYPTYRIFIIGVGAALAVILWLLLDRTRFGAMIRAGSQSIEMTRLLGINIKLLFSSTFVLGAGLAALAGVLSAPLRGAEPFMGIEALAIAFVVVVIGGMGSFGGALVGALVIGILQSLMSTIWPEGARLIIFTAMAAIIIMRPYGLFGRA